MSHQSGILPTQNLQRIFKDAASTSTRAIKVEIKKSDNSDANALFLDVMDVKTIAGSWEEDFVSLESWYDETQPCFVLFQLETTLSTGDLGWMLIQYVPDNSKVRDKMLYASSKATLTKELGDMKFQDTLYATSKADITLGGYKRHRIHQAADAPLSEKEIEYRQVMKNEAHPDTGLSTRHIFAAGVSLPVSNTSREALSRFKNKEENLVVLKIDVEKECIDLHKTAIFSGDNLQSHLTDDEPFYIFLDYGVKRKMMCSSSRSGVLDFVEQFGISVSKKIEVDTVTEINQEFLNTYVSDNSGALGLSPKSFKKPARPTRK